MEYLTRPQKLLHSELENLAVMTRPQKLLHSELENLAVNMIV